MSLRLGTQYSRHVVGFEPSILGFRVECSTTVLQGHNQTQNMLQILKILISKKDILTLYKFDHKIMTYMTVILNDTLTLRTK
jgi:hypothetical protein